MYAVIFTAEINEVDEEYFSTAQQMRELAIEKYGCLEFKALTEGDQEVAISYWPSLEYIGKWKDDPEHLKAQQLGRERWYNNYKVQVVRVEYEYEKSA